MGVIGLGNALMDILVHIDNEQIITDLSLAKAGMTMIDLPTHIKMMKLLEHSDVTNAAGGSAANTINGLVKLGGKGAFIGKVGRDKTGELFVADQVMCGIKPYIEVSETDHSGKCISLVHPCGERTMATFLGAAITMTPESIPAKILTDYKVIYIEGYLTYNHELVETAMKQAKEVGLYVALDLSSYTVVEDNFEFITYLVDKYVDIVFANEEEAASFTSQSDPQKALNCMAKNCPVAVVKIGARGSLVAVTDIIGRKDYKAGVLNAVPVDKTGAGDMYAAGFLYGYCKNLPIEMCAQIGAVLSSKVIEVMGPKMNDEIWIELNKLVAKIEAGQQLDFEF